MERNYRGPNYRLAVDSWCLMMTHENKAHTVFAGDLPDDLAKRIEELIAEHYPVAWEPE